MTTSILPASPPSHATCESFAILRETNSRSVAGSSRNYTKAVSRPKSYFDARPQKPFLRHLLSSMSVSAALIFALSAIAAVVVLAATTSTLLGKIQVRVSGLDSKYVEVLDALRQASSRHRSELAELKAQLAETKLPHDSFLTAQGLYQAGRFADAEAAYSRFLVEFPRSRVADIALLNSALASAHLGNCSMARSRLAQLQRAFPDNASIARHDQIVQSCLASR